MSGIEQVTKEELDAVLENCPILTQDTIRIVEQANKIIALETENAELKRQLSVAHQDYRELSDAAVGVTTERDNLIAENIRITKLRDHDFEELAELAELKRQIAEGELIPSKVAESYLSELSEGNVSEMTLGIKEFAKREAGAK